MSEVLGMTFIFNGLVLRFWGIRELKENFSEFPVKPKYVVKTGIYKWLSHPCYLGSIFVFVGLALIIPNDYRLFLDVYLLYVVLKHQSVMEEKFL